MISYGWEPAVPYPGSVDAQWPGKCAECKKPGKPTLSNAKRQGPCRPCGQAKVAESLRLPLADVVRDMEAKGVIVVGDYTNNREPIECICLGCGALIYPTYSNAMRGGIGLCDKQCKKDRIGDSNRGDAQEAATLALANHLIPRAPYTGADDPWKLECAKCGNVGTKTTYSAIKQLGHVCDPCGRARQAASQRLSETEAVASMRKAKLEPDVPYPGSVSLPWKCTCLVCGAKIRPGPRLNDIRNRDQGGCSDCSDTSFKAGEPSHVYLAVNLRAGYLKWGKANNVDNRLQEHRRQGFDHGVRRWPFLVGADATAAENAIKAAVRACGAKTQIDKALMRYGGHTETASLDEISVAEVVAIIEALVGTYATAEQSSRSAPALALQDPATIEGLSAVTEPDAGRASRSRRTPVPRAGGAGQGVLFDLP
ncbi:hypothetical protein [Kitasatospora sp. NPDC094015]|uniref:hypothetical protein n=1 Tax=Kitasatospora sp. NPDC094015 TaxID=3155205 RepID=UPI00332F4561